MTAGFVQLICMILPSENKQQQQKKHLLHYNPLCKKRKNKILFEKNAGMYACCMPLPLKLLNFWWDLFEHDLRVFK